MHRSIHG